MPRRKGLEALQGAESIGSAVPDVTHAVMPLDPTMLESLGKPVSELLGMLFESPQLTGLPAKLRLTGWNANTGKMALRGLRRGEGEAFDASAPEMDSMINEGLLKVKQPAQAGVDAIRRKLAALLDAK